MKADKATRDEPIRGYPGPVDTVSSDERKEGQCC